MRGYCNRIVFVLALALMLAGWPLAARAQGCYIAGNGDYICDNYQAAGRAPRGPDVLPQFTPHVASSVNRNQSIEDLVNLSRSIQNSVAEARAAADKAFRSGACTDVPVLPVPESGNIVRVSGSDQLRSALANANPGDIIMLGNGTYSGNFNLSKNGTEGQPISIRAENPGQAVFRNANINMSGNYGIVMGAIFDNTGVQINGNHNRVTRNVFRNGGNGTTAITVNKGGSHNRLDHNELTDWGHFGFRVLPNDSTKGNRIDHNYIHDYKNVSSKNEPEAIQIGSGRGNTYMNTGTVIENNLIERVEINGEMISIKSSNTTLRGNTFRNEGMRGTVNGRHGTNNTFANNTFFDVHDVAIRGDDHRMIGNRFVGTDLTVPSGDCTQNQVPTGGGCHPSSRNQLVAGNILEGGGKIDLGGGCCKGGAAAQNITLAGNQGSVARGGASTGVQTSGNFSGNAGQPVVMTRGQVGPAAAGDGVSGGQAGNCEDGGMQQASAGGGGLPPLGANCKAIFTDNFESGNLNNWSEYGGCYNYSFANVTDPAGSGNRVVRVINRMGQDNRNCSGWAGKSHTTLTGNAGTANKKPFYSHRAELGAKTKFHYQEDYSVDMRIFFDQNYPLQSPSKAGNWGMMVWQLIATGNNDGYDLGLIATNSGLVMSVRDQANTRHYQMHKLGPIPRGKWADVNIRFKRSTGNDGYVQVTIDGKVVLQYKGTTTYDNIDAMHKIGLYYRPPPNNNTNGEFKIYYDDIRAAQCM